MVYRISGYVVDKQKMVHFVCNNIRPVAEEPEVPPDNYDEEEEEGYKPTRMPHDQICALLFSGYLRRTFRGRVQNLHIFTDENEEYQFYVPTTVIRKPEGYNKPESELDIAVRDLLGSIEGDPLDAANMKYITRTERSESLKPHLSKEHNTSTMVYRISGYVLDKQKMVGFVYNNIRPVAEEPEVPPDNYDEEEEGYKPTRMPHDQICALLFSGYLRRTFRGRVRNVHIFRDENDDEQFYIPTTVIRKPEGYNKPESELDIAVRDLLGSIEGDPLDAANMKYITRTERSLPT